VQPAPPLAAEATSSVQQTEPEAAGGGNTKKDKEKLRKERQRQRKSEEAWEALQGAIAQMEEAAGSVDAVEAAMQAAEKHEARSEKLAALVAEARELIEQARAAEAAKVAAAAEVAEAAAAVEAAAKAAAAAELLQMEAQMAALALRMQEAQAQLGSSVVPPVAPAPHPDAEDNQCVLCLDAPMDHIIIPCGHQCVCGACAETLKKARRPLVPSLSGAHQRHRQGVPGLERLHVVRMSTLALLAWLVGVQYVGVQYVRCVACAVQ
jgi:hypothetical protein